ncbi:hypothetical protein [Nannocystis pusilla]
MVRLARLCAFTLLVACDGGAPPPADNKPAPDKPAAAAPARKEVADRSQTPLVTTRETVGGLAVSIDIPAGLKRDANERDKYVNWTFADGNPFMDPSITIKFVEPMMAPKDLPAFVRSATPKTQDNPPPVVARQEELPGGGMIVVTERSDHLFFKVDALHRNGDKQVRCTLIQRTGTGKPDDPPVPSYPATRAWAEKICESVKIE